MAQSEEDDLAKILSDLEASVATQPAKVRGKITRVEMQKLLDGVKLEDGLQKVDSARVLDQNEQSSLVEIVLHSGKNRIVRRLFEAIGFPVLDLTRKSFGPLRLGNIKPGQFREISKLEVSSLMEAAPGSQGPRKKR
jgi:pseudouridine synthase